MSYQDVTLRLPPHVIADAESLADHEAVSLGELVQSLLSQELSRRGASAPAMKLGALSKENLRLRLGGDFGRATGWTDLLHRLARKGYFVRNDGLDLSLHQMPSGLMVCAVSELGLDMDELQSRIACA